jgi:alkylation response protein AidB-like acyl-CoA dehydrogenase
MNVSQDHQKSVLVDDLLMQTAARLFSSDAFAKMSQTRNAEFPAGAWHALTETGLHLALLPEKAGGFGVPPRDALILLRVAGEHLVYLPFAETMLATWLLAAAGLPIPEGPLTAGPVLATDHLTLSRVGDRWRVQGDARRIPWGRDACALAAFADHDDGPFVVLVPRSGWQATPGTNMAAEPRDTLRIDARLEDAAVVPAPAGIGPAEFRAVGAAMRSLQLAGAMARVRDMSIQYAQDRVQFGRSLAKFQVVQHYLAILAAQVAAAVAASDIASEAVDTAVRVEAIAVAKARTSEAASSIASIAHQLHGAMGFTEEHNLHRATKRLWSCREEFGNEIQWQRLLGRRAAEQGPAQLWAGITSF